MQHRAYQPILPCGNKFLQQKWDRTHYAMHKRKVKSAKPTVSTGPPKTYDHIQVKLKKLKLEEERISIIQRDNKKLLDKMSVIMRTSGRIDNRNHYVTKREKQQQELQRITKENQVIVERLSRCGPKYSVQKWNQDWQRTEEYRESIARYPRGMTVIKTLSKSKKQKNLKEEKGEKSVKEGGNGGGDNAASGGNKSREKTESHEEKDAEAQNSAIKDSAEKDKITQE